MGVLKFKIFSDIWHNKGRTLQVILIIGIGAAAIGMIMGTRNLVIPGMQESWHAFNPAMIQIFVGPPVTEDELQTLRREKGVVAIEGLSSTTVEYRVNPGDEWRPANLIARATYQDQEMNKLELVEGEWPSDDVMLIERSFDTAFGIPKDGKISFLLNDKEYTVQLGGLMYNQFTQPAYFGGTPVFYTTVDRYDILVGNRNFSQLLVRAERYDETQVTELADRLQAKLKKMGKESGRIILDPNNHFFQDTLDGLFFMLGALGALALGLGLLLVYNTINTLVLQQVDQIGVMKAVGAGTGHIARYFFVLIFIYGLLSLAVALPIGVYGAWGITSWLISSFGADPGEFDISRQAVLVQAGISLIAPLLAAIIPIWRGSRITVREAISTYGLSTRVGMIERIGAKMKYLSRMLLITISNTFRHKARVVLMEIALVVSGLMFMMVVSVRDSVVYTVRDVIFQILAANITLVFEEPVRISYLEEVTLSRSDIKAAEMWGLANATIRPRGKEKTEDDESMLVLGVPLPTQLYGYQMREGRWLTPQDDHAVVLNMNLAKDIGVKVGDWVTVQYDDKTARDFQVVGLIFDPILTTSGNVPREVFLRDVGQAGKASTVWIQTHESGVEAEERIAKALRAYYKSLGIKVAAQRGVFGLGSDSTTATGTTFINQFNFLVILLGIMAVLIGSVGSIALSGALSLSVLERRREIGVMRAIGASSWSIFRLFIGEGLLLGWLSWLIALPLAWPAGKLMVEAMGAAFNLSLVHHATFTGPLLWLGIITILSVLASWLPALGATHISVRESLAYQ